VAPVGGVAVVAVDSDGDSSADETAPRGMADDQEEDDESDDELWHPPLPPFMD
jgi:hypothetical protein